MKNRVSRISNFVGGGVLLLCLTLPGPSFACMRSPIEAQKAWMMHLREPGEDARPPREQLVEEGTMISILLPESTKVIQTDTNGEVIKLVQQLDEQAYQNVMNRIAGYVKNFRENNEPIELKDKHLQAMAASSHRAWFHFFAANAATGYLQFKNNQASGFVRLEIVRKAPPPRAAIHVDSPEQRVYYREKTLLLDLPGSLGSQWQLSPSSGSASIRSLRASDKPGRVQLEMAIEPTEPDMMLTIANGDAKFALVLRPAAVPTC